jgi:putative ABC transport system permease protein
MLKNYFTIALRSLRMNKLYSSINVSGLAIAMACCILIGFFIHHELTFDDFHEKANRIYRVIKVDVDLVTGKKSKQAFIPSPLGPALVETFPEVEKMTRVTPWAGWFKIEETAERKRFLYVDSTFFEIFSFTLLRGNPRTALKDNRLIVLSQEMAREFFGADDPMGRTVRMVSGSQAYEFTVTGISAPVPKNSSLQFDTLIPTGHRGESTGQEQLTDWRISNTETYVQLASSGLATPLQEKFPAFIKTHFEFPPAAIELQPLRDMYLDTQVNAATPRSHPAYSLILGSIGALILFLACVNFMNLSIGQSSARIKEIGLRKVLGAVRAQLVKQFLGEAVITSVLATALGLFLAELFLPAFNELTNRDFSIWEQARWQTVLFLLLFALLVGVASGSYPALVLSSFRAVEILKAKFKFSGSNLFSRVLIIFQFCISIFLIASTVVISQQLEYMRTKDLGYNGEQVVVIPLDPKFQESYKNEILQHHGVIGAASAQGPFGSGMVTFRLTYEDRPIWMRAYAVDYSFLDLLEIEIVEGRNFNKEMATDADNAVIVNETFVKEFGIESPLGRRLPGMQGMANPEIIGVVRDFHFRSLRYPIEPLVLYCEPSWSIFVKISPIDMPATLDFLRNKWKIFEPNKTFRYDFLDEYVDNQYKEEETIRKMTARASVLAIVIACMGLLGLTLLAAVRRTKEIGIRKVLGAGVLHLTALLSKEFLLLVLAANVIVWPLVYFAQQEFMKNFAFQADVGLKPFLLAGILAFVVALVTISFQTIRAALAKPVESLRYE